MVFRCALLASLLLLVAGCAMAPPHVPVEVLPTEVYHPSPHYPASAARQRLEGMVTLLILVDTSGRVADVKIERSSGVLALDKAALAVSKVWTFTPEMIDGVPKDSYVRVPVNFSLLKTPPSGQTIASLRTRQPPIYPASAVQQHHEGTTTLVLLVGADGMVKSIRVAQSSGYVELDDAAMAAANQWQFIPATKSGVPIECYVRLPVNFSIPTPSVPTATTQ
jgi:TonB family protein